MARNLQHIAVTKEWTIGPMLVQSFLDTFLPASTATGKTWLSDIEDLESLASRAKSPAEIYERLVSANVFGMYSTLERAIIVGCSQQENIHEVSLPGFVFQNIAARSLHRRRLGYMKLEICCFSADNTSAIQKSEMASRNKFGYAELFFKVQADSAHDIYIDAFITRCRCRYRHS
ncbi:hypothetical protein C8Q74DRAFT_164993 [Fomes fomentarius]|nr:hypothetical protein C8Q74DRAFT_164993 [Fomes fomentarius]